MEKTLTIFRVDKDNTVFALFPELSADTIGLYCMAYQHIGQHSAADYKGCISNSRLAAPHEYAELRRELIQIGYNLKIRRRYMRK